MGVEFGVSGQRRQPALRRPAAPVHLGDVMPILHRTRGNSSDPNTAPAAPLAEVPHAADAPSVPRTRTSIAWAAIWTAAIAFIALIVFMLQNTRSIDVSFLGMHGTLPLAIALLIAVVGGVLLTLVFGTVRITQLRRLVRGLHS
jgi:uncharacterized integral membrane protein